MSRLNAVTLLLAAATLGGCSYFSAQEQLNQADRAFDEIERGGAEEASAYHYHAAGLYLERARRENRSSDFVSAERFATRSLEHSSRALERMGTAPSSVGDVDDTWGEAPVNDDPWGDAPAAEDPWGEGAVPDDANATPEASVVEIIPVPVPAPMPADAAEVEPAPELEPVPMDEGVPEATAEPIEDSMDEELEMDGHMDMESDPEDLADPDVVVLPEEPGTADLVIEPVE